MQYYVYRQKISEAKKGEKHHMYGKHWSEEAKQKISAKYSSRNNALKILRKNGATLLTLATLTRLSRQQISFICCTP